MHTAEYANFLKAYIPVFSELLLSVTTPQTSSTDEHKLRNVLLEVLNRLPPGEALKQYVPQLVKLTLRVITEDNEEVRGRGTNGGRRSRTTGSLLGPQNYFPAPLCVL